MIDFLFAALNVTIFVCLYMLVVLPLLDLFIYLIGKVLFHSTPAKKLGLRLIAVSCYTKHIWGFWQKKALKFIADNCCFEDGRCRCFTCPHFNSCQEELYLQERERERSYVAYYAEINHTNVCRTNYRLGFSTAVIIFVFVCFILGLILVVR